MASIRGFNSRHAYKRKSVEWLLVLIKKGLEDYRRKVILDRGDNTFSSRVIFLVDESSGKGYQRLAFESEEFTGFSVKLPLHFSLI